jgi:NADPH-dependent 2,4-dienoyl-CoA reductase/sulfur reductase-like enzyme
VNQDAAHPQPAPSDTTSGPDPDGHAVVVGAGLAGARVAVGLREAGWRGPVTLIGAERHAPYDRPPLSKAVLLEGLDETPSTDVNGVLDVNGVAHAGAGSDSRTVSTYANAGPPVGATPRADGASGAGTPSTDVNASSSVDAAPRAGAASHTETPSTYVNADHPAVRAVTLDLDFESLGIRLHPARRALALDPARRTVETDAGPLTYEAVFLATGASARALDGALTLRTVEDALTLRQLLARKAAFVVVGAGWIGAEFTTAARKAGCEVTVVEAAGRPLEGLVPPALGERMRDWYAEAGATLRTGTPVARVAEGGRGVVLADGTHLAAAAVLAGIGARPDTAWLHGSGVPLEPDGSVRADAWLRVPGVPGGYAVGDCASFPSARYGRRMLVHHWDNAFQAPRTAVAHAVGARAGEPVAPYDPVPYFWSEQFGRFVQYAGDHAGADRLVARGEDAYLWLRDGVLTATLAVDRPRDLAQGRRLMATGARIDPDRAADPAVPLKSAVL